MILTKSLHEKSVYYLVVLSLFFHQRMIWTFTLPEQEVNMQTLITSKNRLPTPLLENMLADRKRQFVDRLKWDLVVTPSGFERDEYDDELADYLIIHDGHRHLGSCRLRGVNSSNMVVDHFQNAFPKANELLRLQKGRVCELTRFCRAPHLSTSESTLVLGQITTLMDRYRDRRGLAGYVAIVFPSVARFMNRIGMKYVVLDRSVHNGSIVELICITQSSTENATAPKIQRMTRKHSAALALEAA